MGRVKAEEEADRRSKADCKRDSSSIQLARPARHVRHRVRAADTQYDTTESADYRQRNSFNEELTQNVPAAGNPEVAITGSPCAIASRTTMGVRRVYSSLA
jgi:hypothetical protein